MGFNEKKYGVTWNAKTASTPTTVWFNSPEERNKFIRGLLRNKVVLKDSIITHNKNVPDDEL